MSKIRKIAFPVILGIILLSVVLSTTSCSQVNTTTTGGKYDTALIGKITSADGNTPIDILWKACKTVGSNYKYYPLADYKGTDSVSLETARADAVKKQIDLASKAGAVSIVIPNEFADVYSAIFTDYTDKSFSGSHFLFVTYAGSAMANAAVLKERMTSLVIESAQYGYLFGYTAVKAGYTAPGFLGLNGDEAKALYAGMIQGAQAAAAEISVNVVFNYSLVSSASEAEAKATELYGICDIVLGDFTCDSAVLGAAKTSGKAAMSTKGLTDDTVAFAYSTNDNYITKISAAITASKTQTATAVISLSAGDLIYNFTSKADFVFKSDAAIAQMMKFQDTAFTVSSSAADLNTANVTVTQK